MKELSGIATGIGSLPFEGPHAARDAVQAVLTHFPQLPFWPQLPKLGPREGMLMQFIEGLPCLKAKDKDVIIDNSSRDNELESFYEKLLADDPEPFAISREYAAGFYEFMEHIKTHGSGQALYLKGHITGPFTFAAGTVDEHGKALLHDEVLMQALIKGLAMKARWQVRHFRSLGCRAVIFIDEPYLAAFGSAYTPLTKEAVVEGLTDLVASFKEEGVLVGVHCCGNTDWSLFTDTPGIDIINFDAYGFADKVALYAPSFAPFLESGGYLCWGVVPTQEIETEPSAKSLAERVRRGMDAFAAKGIARALLTNNLLVSPSCGLGSLKTSQAALVLERVGQVCAELSRK